MKLEQYQKYLDEIVVPVRLAGTTNSGWPLILSLWYIYEEGFLYCATQSGAKIVTHLQNDPRCAFEIASDNPPYCGIRGQAKVEILPELGERILEQLLVRYLGNTTNRLAKILLRNKEKEVAIRIQPINVFAWDFTDRMKEFSSDEGNVCPDILSA